MSQVVRRLEVLDYQDEIDLVLDCIRQGLTRAETEAVLDLATSWGLFE